MAQGTSGPATRPHNSALIKLPIRPRPSPMGTKGAKKSLISKKVLPVFLPK